MLETKRVDLSQLGGLDKHPDIKIGEAIPTWIYDVIAEVFEWDQSQLESSNLKQHLKVLDIEGGENIILLGDKIGGLVIHYEDFFGLIEPISRDHWEKALGVDLVHVDWEVPFDLKFNIPLPIVAWIEANCTSYDPYV